MATEHAPERHIYAHAPITEAVLEIRTAEAPTTALEQLERTNADSQDRFPTQRDAVLVTGEFTVGAEMASSTRQARNGFVFVSEDEQTLYQARLNGFAFSQIGEYDRWETFRDVAMDRWRAFRREAPDTPLVRLGLRYINKINLPVPFTRFEDYLKSMPALPESLPQSWSSYLMTVGIPFPDRAIMSQLTTAILPQDSADQLPMLLDIDVFIENGPPLHVSIPPTDENIWAAFESMHEVKNLIFEESITDETRRLFE